jgi:hypothetical protein
MLRRSLRWARARNGAAAAAIPAAAVPMNVLRVNVIAGLLCRSVGRAVSAAVTRSFRGIAGARKPELL